MPPILSGGAEATSAPTPIANPSSGSVYDKIEALEEESTPILESSGSAIVDKVEAITNAEADEAPQEDPIESPAVESESKDEAEAVDTTDEKPENESNVEYITAEDGTKLRGDHVISKKVDGKPVKISLKELIDDFSGKTAVKTRFAEVNQLKQRVETQQKKMATDLAKVTTTVTKFLDSAKAGNHRDALDALCELTGADPERTWNEQKSASDKQIQEYFSMTPEQRALHETNQESAYWKRQATSNKPNELQQVTLEKKIAHELTEAATKFGLSGQELRDGNKLVLDLVDKGVYSQDEITVDVVASESLNLKIWGQIDNFCKDSLPEMRGNPEFYRDVLKDTREHGISKAQWTKLFNELKGTPAKPTTKSVTSSLADKVKKSSALSSKTQVTKSKNADKDFDPISFDEI